MVGRRSGMLLNSANHLDVVRCLVQKGADVNAKGKQCSDKDV